MLTDVIEGANRPVLLPRANYRLTHEIMDDEIAGLLKLNQPARNVPDFGPHVLPLFMGKGFRVITITGYRIPAQ